MISQRKLIEVRPIIPYLQARYAQFSRKITRAIGYRDMPLVLRAACLSNRKYRVSSRSLASVSHLRDPCQARYYFPLSHLPYTPRRCRCYSRKISILHFDDDLCLARSSEEGTIARRKKKMTVSHRRRRFAVINNCSKKSPWWQVRRGTRTDTLRARSRSTKFNAKHFIINTLPSLGTGGCGFELFA